MNEFSIDPSKGPDAAADASNEQLEVLLQILMWELALRTTRETYDEYLARLAKARHQLDKELDSARRKRDQARFVASVLDDLARLPVAGKARSEPTTGLYL